jgi:transcriptional regulator GlxA family with amidase domain
MNSGIIANMKGDNDTDTKNTELLTDKAVQSVTILGLEDSMATTIFGPMDILTQAGRLWNRVGQSPPTPFFNVTIATADGQPIRCANNVMVQPHSGIDEIHHSDLVVIASATHIEQILYKSPELVPWIRRQYRQGAHVASICTGVFLLAETGLLDGKSVTLHWGFTRLFRKRYPQVTLASHRMFIDQGRLYCSAGVNAGMDLSLYLVEKMCGRQAAVESAKAMVLDLGRELQTPYGALLLCKDQGHGDPLVMKAQQWIERHHTQSIDYDILAGKLRMSRRSLERRFKQATGVTPLGYLQQLRVETAKRLLEEGLLSFNEITYHVGYEDIPFFRKVFIRQAGIRPKEYQQRFRGYAAASVMH